MLQQSFHIKICVCVSGCVSVFVCDIVVNVISCNAIIPGLTVITWPFVLLNVNFLTNCLVFSVHFFPPLIFRFISLYYVVILYSIFVCF